jgi:ABC-2 type transport system ATP-binding protein
MELEGTVTELAQQVLGRGYHIMLEAEGEAPALLAALRQLPGAVEVAQNGARRYRVAAREDLRGEAASAVVAAGGRLLTLTSEAPSLDEIYARYFEEVEHGTAG